MLIEAERYRIIHLTRRNLLRQYVSLMKAYSSNTWRVRPGGRELSAYGPVHLDAAACKRYLVDLTSKRERYGELPDGPRVLNVEYEALASDPSSTGKDIQEFLGLEHRHLAPDTGRLSSLPLSEQISNYAEIEEAFRGPNGESF